MVGPLAQMSQTQGRYAFYLTLVCSYSSIFLILLSMNMFALCTVHFISTLRYTQCVALWPYNKKS